VNVDAKAAPLQLADALFRCLFGHFVGELNEAVTRGEWLITEQSGEIVLLAVPQEVALEQHIDSRSRDWRVYSHCSSERCADAREKAGQRQPQRMSIGHAAEDVEHLVDRYDIFAGNAQHASGDVGARKDLCEGPGDVLMPDRLKGLTAVVENGYDRKRPHHAQQNRHGLIAGAHDGAGTHDGPVTGEPFHQLLALAFRAMISGRAAVAAER
jgi:hypothetical protein